MAASSHPELENGGIESIDESIVEEMKLLNQEFEAAEVEIGNHIHFIFEVKKRMRIIMLNT